MTEEIVDLVERALEDVEPIVAAIGPDQYDRPTPCEQFDLRALLAHLIGGLRSIAQVAEGGPFAFDLDPDLSRADALAEYRAAGTRFLAAWRAPGVVDRVYAAPWGDAPGSRLVGFTFLEVIQHGWDLARAAGLDRTVDADLAAKVLEAARQWVDESARQPMLFGPEVAIADDAPVPDRLAAFLGRHP